ncbi:hypothetical protein F5Y19DRAFT_19802 [Xylariaceae sp. FL1651]|nr:hypothetical protein F5Y19DRAFT_19802 [Xylariaceae sp. FL1651]
MSNNRPRSPLAHELVTRVAALYYDSFGDVLADMFGLPRRRPARSASATSSTSTSEERNHDSQEAAWDDVQRTYQGTLEDFLDLRSAIQYLANNFTEGGDSNAGNSEESSDDTSSSDDSLMTDEAEWEATIADILRSLGLRPSSPLSPSEARAITRYRNELHIDLLNPGWEPRRRAESVRYDIFEAARHYLGEQTWRDIRAMDSEQAVQEGINGDWRNRVILQYLEQRAPGTRPSDLGIMPFSRAGEDPNYTEDPLWAVYPSVYEDLIQCQLREFSHIYLDATTVTLAGSVRIPKPFRSDIRAFRSAPRSRTKTFLYCDVARRSPGS